MKLLTKVNRCFWDDIPTLKRPGGFFFLLALSIFTTGSFYSKTALANTNDIELPKGAKIVNGNINIESNQNQLKIIQSTQQGIINWNSFNIGKNASVHFQQPNAAASTLNRVTSATPSSIFGSLTANGQIFLLNPSGVYFGAGARVNVGSLIASTQSMSNEDFLNQHFLFNQTDLNGEIINAGSIIGDQVAMVSPRFTNLGDITAKSGDVVIASGDKVKLAITQNQSIAVELDASQVANLIDNQGTINAQGNIVFKADAMQSIVDQTIKLPQSANMMVSDNGTVRLVTNTGSVKATNVAMDAGALGGTYNNGVIDVSQENFQGGNISLTGQEVKVASLSKLNASGSTGGGSILIGGDWQGQGDTPQATYTVIEKGATLDASATDLGDGGTIVAWSDIHDPLSETFVGGNFIAHGGFYGGNGGQIETSGYNLKANDILVDTTANGGREGLWLLDPADFTVAASGGNTTGNTISTQLATTNVEILSTNGTSSDSAKGLILINDSISWSADTQLTLNAMGPIFINESITATGTGAGSRLQLKYGQASPASGNTSFYSIARSPSTSLFTASINLPSGTGRLVTKQGYDGTEQSFYSITSKADLLSNITGTVSGNFVLGANINSVGTWTSAILGSSGTLDGLGHSINNLSGTNNSFFSTAAGTIQNLGLSGTKYCYSNCGGFAGIGQAGLVIRNSYNAINVTQGGNNLGGLVGEATGVKVLDSSNIGNITSSWTNNQWFGGIFGMDKGGNEIRRSWNTGTIESTGGRYMIGGLIGQKNSNTMSYIYDSYNTGTVTGNVFIGGLVGEVQGNLTIQGSYNSGTVTNYSSSSSRGGLVGGMRSLGGNTADLTVIDSYWNSKANNPQGANDSNYHVTNSSYLSDMNTVSNYSPFSTSNIWSNSSAPPTLDAMAAINAYSYTSNLTEVTFTINDWADLTYGTSIDLSNFLSDSSLFSLSSSNLDTLFSANPTFGLYSNNTLTTFSDNIPDAGSYTIRSSGGTLNSGFLVSYINGALTINPKALTVNSVAYSNKTYDGDAVADVTLSISGTVGEETLSYTPTATFTSRNVGTQTVTVDTIAISDGTGDADNYSITTGQTGTATINQLSSVAWTGLGGNALWSNATNWAGSAIPDASNVATVNIGSADTVTFNADSVGSMNSVINNSGVLTLNTDSSYTFFSQILGTGSVSKAGSGTFTLSSAENNYSGDTTISSGTLQITGLLGRGNYAADINNASNLKLNTSATQTLSGNLSGAGDLIKAGSNSLIITQANSGFSGNVAINNGLIQTRNNTALGSTGRITIATGAALDIKGYSLSNPFTIAGTGIANSGAIYNSATSALSQLSGNITLDETATIKSNGDITFDGAILGQSGENNSLTISAAEKKVTLNGLIGADPSTYTGISGANPYALSVTAGTIKINNNITTNQNQTYTGNVVVGGNQVGSSGEERILLSLNPSITINGSINDETTSTHSLTLRSITQLGYSDVPSITLNGTVGATKPLNDLNLIAMYDSAPVDYYGKIPTTRDTSPYYTGSIDIQSNVNVSDEVILTGRTVDLNDAVLTASNIELYGYAAIAGESIDLGTGSIFGSSNFASMSAVNDAEYFAVEIAAAPKAAAAASSSSSESRAASAASQVAARIKPPKIKAIKVPQSFKAPSPIAIAATAPIAAPKPTVTVKPATINAPAPKADGGSAPSSDSSSSAPSSDSSSSGGGDSDSPGGGDSDSSGGGDSDSGDDEEEE